MCFSKEQISTEKKEDEKWDTSYPWNAWRDVSMPFDCTSESSISAVVVLGNTVAGTARSDSPPEPSLKLSGNPPSKLVMAVGSCTRISSICNAKGPAVVISATLETKQKERKREQRVPSQYIRVTFPARASRQRAPRNTESKSSCSNLSFFLPSLLESLLNYFEETKKRFNKKETKQTAICLARREE